MVKRKILTQAIIVPFLLFATSLTVQAQDKTQIDIATKYYDALYAGDFDTVRIVASSGMVFEDPSAPREFGIPPELNNLEAFLNFMEANLGGEINITYTEKFLSNDRVVLMVETDGVVPASLVGMGDEGDVTYSSRGVSILHVADGKVIRHTDYFDYPALAESFKRIQ